MFEFKHQIELKTSETIMLFGEDYFADKSTFWNSHQTTLAALCKKVCASGFPVKITDLESNRTSIINNKKEFDSWLEGNQPYQCTCSSLD